MTRLRVAWLTDGKRLHIKSGLVDLIVQAFGPPSVIGHAHDAAIERARALVAELGDDMPRLHARQTPLTKIGARAAAACRAVPGDVAPVVAVKGAVADEVLAAMTAAGPLDRAFVNNHGAVAFHLAEGQTITPMAMDWLAHQRYEAKLNIPSTARSRGLAAGGWLYDGFALGWVDRIYVAATSAAMAEAGLGSIAGCMVPAQGAATVAADTIQAHGELGTLPVYPALAQRDPEATRAILAQGQEITQKLYDAGIITLALLQLAENHFLAAPSYLSLRAMLNLED